MGESMVDSLNADKLGETTPSNPALEVSVSFGRFDNDALSWEKWSSFSPNKYLEEVEKCATPGSVAQKKAYFEAHYKKIAARKAELLELEKQMDNSGGDPIENKSRTDTELDISDSEIVKQEMKIESLEGESGDSQTYETNETGFVKQEIKLACVITEECQSLPVEEVKEEILNSSVDNHKFVEAEITTEEKEKETPTLVSPELEETRNFEKEEEKTVKVIKVENLKSQHSKEPHKVTPASKEKNMAGIKKKPASPMSKAQFSTPYATRTHFSTLSAPKSQISAPKTQFSAPKSHFSTPRVSKPAPTSLTMSMSRSSMVKGNSSSLLRNKNPSYGESKKVNPKSLHMSISLGHRDSDPLKSDSPSPMTTRKSFIMEQMGDKEIVKRAFKSFQNHYNQFKSPSEVKSTIPNQVPNKATQPRVNSSVTPRKENGGILKAAVMDKKNAKSAPSTLGLKNDDRTEKRREFSKTSNEKYDAIAKEAGKTRLETKSKEIIKQADIKQPRQTLNSKATLMPGVHRGVKASRNPSDKGIFKN